MEEIEDEIDGNRKYVKIHFNQKEEEEEEDDEEEEEDDEERLIAKAQELLNAGPTQISAVNSKMDLDELRNKLVASKNAEHAIIFDTKHLDETYDILSIDPSYTNYDIPYGVQCRIRYSKKCRIYDKQFKMEMKMLEIYQQNAYEAARFSRHLGMTTLWPPLHNRREVDKFIHKFFVHSPKDHKRLQNLLKEPQI